MFPCFHSLGGRLLPRLVLEILCENARTLTAVCVLLHWDTTGSRTKPCYDVAGRTRCICVRGPC